MNHIVLIGNVGRDPEARGKSGDIASFSLAVNSRRKGGEKETQWFNCVAFGKTGESILANVTKGSQLAVTGKLKSNTWERDGVKHQDLDVIINTWEFVSAKGSERYPESVGQNGPATWSPDGRRWP